MTGWSLALVLILGAVNLWVFAGRYDVAKANNEVRQNYATNVQPTPQHERFLEDWQGALPLERPVVYADRSSRQLQSVEVTGDAAGCYSPSTGVITIATDAKENGVVVVHEWGHALLMDVLTELHGGDPALAAVDFASLDAPLSAVDFKAMPRPVVPLIQEYEGLNPNALAGNYRESNSYALSSFNEYFAESFMLYNGGQAEDVPPLLRHFFKAVERGEV